MPPPPSDQRLLRAGRTHLSTAQGFLDFAAWLRLSKRGDPTTVGWAVTAIFYAALHATRAYLVAEKGVEVTSHDEMKDHLEAFPELRRTQVSYDLLEQKSQAARYYGDQTLKWYDYEQLLVKANAVVGTWRPKAEEALARLASTSGRPQE